MRNINKIKIFSNHTPKSNEIEKEWICCIDSIEQTRYGIKYILPNRDLALQALYRFVTGQDMTTSSILPEEAQKKMKIIV